jgi:hypothetical protein
MKPKDTGTTSEMGQGRTMTKRTQVRATSVQKKNNQWHFLVLIRYRYLAHKPGVKKIDVKFAIIYILIQRLK